jgi:RNA polymerase subunit RPABC4/transcription elongation factor Spt4
MVGILLAQMQVVPSASGLSDSISTAMLLGSLLMGVATLFIWKNKEGSPVIGFLLGFLLGLIGLIIVLVAHPTAAKRREKEARERMLQQMGTRTGAFEPLPLAAQQAAAPYPVAAPAPQATVMPMRACPHCGHRFQCNVTICPKCGTSSEPWWHNSGYWFTKNTTGNEYWLEPTRQKWLLYRRTAGCPSCSQVMPANAAICPQCGVESNALA